MATDVLCLRPEADFARAGVTLPSALSFTFRTPSDGDVAGLLRSAHALVLPAVGPALPAGLFEGGQLQLIQVTGAGVDRLDRNALTQLGIPVANVPGGSNSAVSEYAITAASILMRDFLQADAEVRRGNYSDYRAHLLAENRRGLVGLLVGVVGLGVIGNAVAKAFHGVGCRICYYDPAPRDVGAIAEMGARSLSLAELLRASDVVTLHVPLVPATQGFIGAGELAMMKRGAVLIQSSRGGVVDEDALANALKSGHLGGAAVDVYSSEPPGPDHPLLRLTGEAARRVLFTPHIAGVTQQSLATLLRSALVNVERVLLHGEKPLNRVY